jgi:hypothetical protein
MASLAGLIIQLLRKEEKPNGAKSVVVGLTDPIISLCLITVRVAKGLETDLCLRPLLRLAFAGCFLVVFNPARFCIFLFLLFLTREHLTPESKRERTEDDHLSGWAHDHHT